MFLFDGVFCRCNPAIQLAPLSLKQLASGLSLVGHCPMQQTFSTGKTRCYLFETASGHCALVYLQHPLRLVRVFLPCTTKKHLKEKLGAGRFLQNQHPARIYSMARTIENYYCGRRISVPWCYFDFSAYTANQIKIYREVATIPYGRVRTYGEVADRAGMAGASRFVGNCMARNPYPIFIPCHRVIRSDGSLGGFGGGLDLKQKMLDMESHGGRSVG
jgi:methylated-DNA-[protein]-cysteine S-methyltransferase